MLGIADVLGEIQKEERKEEKEKAN